MPGRDALSFIAILTLGACGGGERDDLAAGRLVLEDGRRTLVDAPATASRCPADSTLAVVATGEVWATAFSVRMHWPADSIRDIAVGSILGSQTAVVAARPVADSIGTALVSVSGTLTVEAGRVLHGRLAVLAASAPGAPDTVRLTGRFDGIAVTDDLCTPTVER